MSQDTFENNEEDTKIYVKRKRSRKGLVISKNLESNMAVAEKLVMHSISPSSPFPKATKLDMYKIEGSGIKSSQ